MSASSDSLAVGPSSPAVGYDQVLHDVSRVAFLFYVAYARGEAAQDHPLIFDHGLMLPPSGASFLRCAELSGNASCDLLSRPGELRGYPEPRLYLGLVLVSYRRV
jgi:hypothetical protein